MHEFCLPLGPQHPALIEPVHLKLRVDGETIVGLDDLQLGYNHKGIEKSLEKRSWTRAVFLSERICGICLPTDQEIITDQGDIVRIGDFAENHIGGSEERFVSKETDGKTRIFSMKESRIGPGKITHVQRFRSPERILEIETHSGHVIKATHAHKVPVDTFEGKVYVTAKGLKKGDLLYSARKINIINEWKPLIIDLLPDDFSIKLEKGDLKKFNEKLTEKFGNLSNAGREMKIYRTKFGMNHLRNGIKIGECRKVCEKTGMDWVSLKRKIRKVSNEINHFTLVKSRVDRDMMYLLGLIASDGCFGKVRSTGQKDYRLSFVNKDKTLLDEFEKAYKGLFPGKRIEKRRLKSESFVYRVSNPLLSEIAKSLGFRALDSEEGDLKPLFKMPRDLIASFVGGYFDGDGHCKIQNKSIMIYVYCKSRQFLRRFQMLMKRIGVACALRKRGPYGFKKGYSYIIKINNAVDANSFCSFIDSRLPRKRKVLNEIKRISDKSKRFHSNFQMAPLHANKLFGVLRKKHGIPLKRFHCPSHLAKIERGKRVNKETISSYLDEMEKIVGNGKGTGKIRESISHDYHLDKIVSIKEIPKKSEYVYDLTLNPVHNFVVNGGPVVSNCGNFHTSAFTQGVERLLEVRIPKKAEYIRVIVSELERIHSHMLSLGLVAHEMGFDTLFHYIFRDREIPMDLQEMLTGNRVHFSMNVIGGVRRDIDLSKVKEMEVRLDELEDRLYHYINVFKKDISLRKRTKGVGVLSEKKAKELTPVGPNARASNIPFDIREDNYFGYRDFGFRTVTGEGGDVMERCVVRLKECIQSIKMIQYGFYSFPKSGEIARKLPLAISVEKGKETDSSVEAPRGELYYHIKSDGTKPYRVKVRTPTYATFHIAEEIMKGYQIADIPVIVASIDPCMSCTDRVTLVNNRGKEKVLGKEDFHRMNGGNHDH